jgi:hypothetical protein
MFLDFKDLKDALAVHLLVSSSLLTSILTVSPYVFRVFNLPLNTGVPDVLYH